MEDYVDDCVHQKSKHVVEVGALTGVCEGGHVRNVEVFVFDGIVEELFYEDAVL